MATASATKKKTTAKKEPVRITDAQIEQAVKDVKKMLDGQEKVTICIEKTDGDDPVWRGWINGHGYAFPKGEFISVPRDLATFIAQNAKLVQENRALVDRLAKGLEM